jgi:hypothetical protein
VQTSTYPPLARQDIDAAGAAAVKEERKANAPAFRPL